MAKVLEMSRCKKRLLLVWGIGFGIFFLLLLIQTFSGKYGKKYDDAIGWLTPLVVPTLSLMIGVFIADFRDRKQNPQSEDTKADKAFYQIAFYGSIFYFFIIGFVFFLEPLVEYGPFEMMTLSKSYISIINGFVTTLIGYFFVKK